MPAETPGETPATPPFLSMAEAVKACGVSRATLQRRLKAGSVPGAERTPAGGWRIPVAGLIAADLAPRQTPPDAPAATPEPAAADLAALQLELAKVTAERDAARELADAHKATAELLSQTLRSLAPALPPGAVSAPGMVVSAPARAGRRRWWQRSPNPS
jgi:predicted DNA-binding transcriptional regulator AlpA